MNATTGSDHKSDVKHEDGKMTRKIVKKDDKDDKDDDETKQQVKIKKKERVSGPSEGKSIKKVKVEKDVNGKVIPPSHSRKIAKKDLINRQN